MKTRIYLIRHGATAANREVPYRLQGRGSDRPLDVSGIQQAKRAGEALKHFELLAVYSSPLRRALETAEEVAIPHALRPEAVAGLTEAEVGHWEGLTWDEAKQRNPELYERFHANPGTVAYPDGESFADVANRVSPILTELAAAHPGGSIAVVGHNVVNRAVLARLINLPIDYARALRQSNGGINVLEYENHGWTVLTLNSTFHLEP